MKSNLIFREVIGDLFTASNEYSLGNCVARDFKMGAGIAKIFKIKFGSLDVLRNQSRNGEKLAVLPNDGKFIYYLITKEFYYEKPTYENLFAALTAMKDHMLMKVMSFNQCWARQSCGIGARILRVADSSESYLKYKNYISVNHTIRNYSKKQYYSVRGVPTFTTILINSSITHSYSIDKRSYSSTSTPYTNTFNMSSDKGNNIVSVNEAKRFVIDCFMAANTPLEHAKAMSDLLIEADCRGHFSHGMNRLEMYINDLKINSTNGSATPTILSETVATAWVDGNNGLGAVIGNFCMNLAIQKAKSVGIGWVCAKRSNHYGIAGYYTLQAMKEGLIGMSMTNTSPLMSPTRSTAAALGTNPISVAAPAINDDAFVLDMATTAVAVGKIEIQKRKNEPCPLGWAQDPSGQPTSDATIAFDTGCLMPLGGEEITSGYKGYGLGGMVEVFCGILAGSNFSNKIRKWTHAGSDSEANLGQLFVAINPNCFAPGFTERMSEMNDILRNMPAADPDKPVLVPGDPETNHVKLTDAAGGIKYHENQLNTCNALATRLSISPLKFN